MFQNQPSFEDLVFRYFKTSSTKLDVSTARGYARRGREVLKNIFDDKKPTGDVRDNLACILWAFTEQSCKDTKPDTQTYVFSYKNEQLTQKLYHYVRTHTNNKSAFSPYFGVYAKGDHRGPLVCNVKKDGVPFPRNSQSCVFMLTYDAHKRFKTIFRCEKEPITQPYWRQALNTVVSEAKFYTQAVFGQVRRSRSNTNRSASQILSQSGSSSAQFQSQSHSSILRRTSYQPRSMRPSLPQDFIQILLNDKILSAYLRQSNEFRLNQNLTNVKSILIYLANMTVLNQQKKLELIKHFLTLVRSHFKNDVQVGKEVHLNYSDDHALSTTYSNPEISAYDYYQEHHNLKNSVIQYALGTFDFFKNTVSEYVLPKIFGFVQKSLPSIFNTLTQSKSTTQSLDNITNTKTLPIYSTSSPGNINKNQSKSTQGSQTDFTHSTQSISSPFHFNARHLLKPGMIITYKLRDAQVGKSKISRFIKFAQSLTEYAHRNTTHINIVVGFNKEGIPLCVEPAVEGKLFDGICIRPITDIVGTRAISAYEFSNPDISSHMTNQILSFFDDTNKAKSPKNHKKSSVNKPDSSTNLLGSQEPMTREQLNQKMFHLKEGEVINPNSRHLSYSWNYTKVIKYNRTTKKNLQENAEKAHSLVSGDPMAVFCSQFCTLMLSKAIVDTNHVAKVVDDKISPSRFESFLEKELRLRKITIENINLVNSKYWITTEFTSFIKNKLMKYEGVNEQIQEDIAQLKHLSKLSGILPEQFLHRLIPNIENNIEWYLTSKSAKNRRYSKLFIRKFYQVVELSGNRALIDKYNHLSVETFKNCLVSQAQQFKDNYAILKVIEAHFAQRLPYDPIKEPHKFTASLNRLINASEDAKLSKGFIKYLKTTQERVLKLFEYLNPVNNIHPTKSSKLTFHNPISGERSDKRVITPKPSHIPKLDHNHRQR